MVKKINANDVDLDVSKQYDRPLQEILQSTDTLTENVEPSTRPKKIFVAKKTVQGNAKSKINLNQNESGSLPSFDRIFE